jgi:ribosomal protein S18 acetylase RimI-like enzyme
MLAAAFLDDPVWTAVGPRRERHRAITNRLSFWGIVGACSRHGARIRIARRPAPSPGSTPAGATIALEPGRWPLPEVSLARGLPWTLAAGPLPLRRGLGIDRALRQAHVAHPHLYLWFIGVDPDLHGAGVGVALMGDLHQHADELGVPSYLEASSEPNVGFYERVGYRILAEIEAPSGARIWPMERPPKGESASTGGRKSGRNPASDRAWLAVADVRPRARWHVGVAPAAVRRVRTPREPIVLPAGCTSAASSP